MLSLRLSDTPPPLINLLKPSDAKVVFGRPSVLGFPMRASLVLDDTKSHLMPKKDF